MTHETACFQTLLHIHVPSVPNRVRAELAAQMKSQGSDLPEAAPICWVMLPRALDSFDSMCDALSLARDMDFRERWAGPYDALRQAQNFLDAFDLRLQEAMRGMSDADRVTFCRDALVREPAVWSLPTWSSTMKKEPPGALVDLWAKVGKATTAYSKAVSSRTSKFVPQVEAIRFAASLTGEPFVLQNAIIAVNGGRNADEFDSARTAFYDSDRPRAFVDGKKLTLSSDRGQILPCNAHVHLPADAVIPVAHPEVSVLTVRRDGNMTSVSVAVRLGRSGAGNGQSPAPNEWNMWPTGGK